MADVYFDGDSNGGNISGGGSGNASNNVDLDYAEKLTPKSMPHTI